MAWILTEEPFLAGSGLIDNLKLRLGYGELGNQGIDNFETRQTLVAQGSAVFGGSILQGVRPARLPNPNLTWETTREINFGIDYALADYLITGSVDFFRRSTEDQLFQNRCPPWWDSPPYVLTSARCVTAGSTSASVAATSVRRPSPGRPT